MAATRITVSFTDTLLSKPIAIDIPCPSNSPNFPYFIRRVLFKKKRVPPINQLIKKIDDFKYELTIRRRSDNLRKLVIYGHAENEYDVYVDDNDTIMDIKWLLSPLVGSLPEYIQLNYNTERRLNDNENIITSNCLSSDIVIMWWLELPNPNAYKGETCIYRTTANLISYNPIYPNMAISVRKTLNDNPDVETFGVREYLDKNDFNKRGEYKWITYKTVNQKVTNLASGFRKLGLIPHKSKIGICSKNRREWVLSDYAANVQSIVSVPLYSTLDKNAIEYIINHAEIELVVCSADVLDEVNRARPRCSTLKYVVLMDEQLPDEIYAKEKDPDRKTYTHLFSEVLKLGESSPVQDETGSHDELSTIMYTSGTTGNPKGVMLTNRNFACFINLVLQIDGTEKYSIIDPKHLSYLPLAHAYERIVNLASVINTTPIGFSSGTIQGLMEDMKILKPIVFYGVPRVFQKMQDGIMNKINSSNFLMRWMFNYAYNKKLYAIQHRKQPSAFWDKVLWSKFREPFGGKVRFAGSGSAPLSQESQIFLKVCLFESVGEGYGLTETLGGGTGSSIYDVKVGHVGTPGLSTEIKLVNVADMNYLVTDKPLPRGEIYIRGPTVFKGYYRDPDKTAAVLSDDGWFATGDIGIWRAEGKLQIVDRKKNIFKLAQGEYIRPEYIQNVYKLGRFIGNCFVDGNSFETYLVAIVVPDFEALISFINDDKNGLIDLKGATKDIIIKDNRIISLIKECMKIEEEKGELKGFEKVKKFVLKYNEFSQDNGLLTNSMKLKRNVARQRFANEIQKLYKKQSKL